GLRRTRSGDGPDRRPPFSALIRQVNREFKHRGPHGTGGSISTDLSAPLGENGAPGPRYLTSRPPPRPKIRARRRSVVRASDLRVSERDRVFAGPRWRPPTRNRREPERFSPGRARQIDRGPALSSRSVRPFSKAGSRPTSPRGTLALPPRRA